MMSDLRPTRRVASRKPDLGRRDPRRFVVDHSTVLLNELGDVRVPTLLQNGWNRIRSWSALLGRWLVLPSAQPKELTRTGDISKNTTLLILSFGNPYCHQ